MFGRLKSFTRMVFRRTQYRVLSLLGSTSDWAGAVGDGTGSSTVTAPLFWVARTFPEAPPGLWRQLDNGQEDIVRDHPMLRLLRRPNQFYTGVVMWMATVIDYQVDGNAYWLKVRDRGGRVVELWWVPHWMIEPKGDETSFVTHYEYRPGTETFRVSVDDIVHFRFGLDSDEPRKGLSPLKSVLREVYTDDEAASFTASLLKNMGVPGLVVSPKAGVSIDKDQAEHVKENIETKFSGERRGKTVVLTGATDIAQFGFSPEQLLLRELRRIPEERVTAVMGIPAIVAGLGAGLDRSTFCMPGDTRVWTPNGPTEIRDVQPGQIVWSFADGGIEPRRVRDAGATGVKPILSIRTKNRTVRATGNHPLLVRVPGKMKSGANRERSASYAWKRADEIRVGDHVVQAKSVPDQGGTTLPDGTPAEPRLIRFLGAIIGDGTVSAPGVRMSMPVGKRTGAAYREIAADLFTKRDTATGTTAPVAIREVERGFAFSSASEARRLTSLGLGGRAHSKRIPSWVWALSRDLRLEFLAGIVDTDGAIDKRGALTFTFCNRGLTHDVRDLLISVGIQCSNVGHKVIRAANLPQPGIHDEYHAWLFTASSTDQVSEIPFADPLYRERVETNEGRHRSDGFDAHEAGLSADLGFYEVKSIEELPAEPIYDLEIEGSHSFIADGVVVHNTNMGEAREAAYEAGIIPMQRILAEEVLFQLLADFEQDVYVWRFGFDLSKVRVLQEDLYRQAQRHDLLIRGGWEQVAEGRRAMGLDVDETRDRIFLRPLNVEAVPADGSAAPARTPANGNSNGNGAAHLSPDEIAGAVMQALDRRELTTV